MNVENMTNYGKGFVDSLTSPEFKTMAKISMKVTGKVLWREIGLSGITKLGWKLFREMRKMKHHDWSKLEKDGLPKKAIQLLLYPILQMKVLTTMTTVERAQEIIYDILEKTEDELTAQKSAINSLGMPVRELKTCADPFGSWKDFVKKAESVCEQEGFHKVEPESDTEDMFAFNVVYCAANEVAKACGNSTLCFYWCHLDEATFPRMGAQLGFKFERFEKLPTGASKCNFKFSRV